MQRHTCALILLSCSLLAGCFGAGTVKRKNYTWDVKDPVEYGLCPIRSEEKTIVGCPVRPFSNAVESPGAITPDKLIDMWGQPDNERFERGFRTLTYRQGLAWRGLTIFVIIPIPLLLPLGHNNAKLIFQSDRLVHVEYVDNELDAAICGLHSEGPNGFGCITHWH
jgi:hypothetical protein